MIDSLNERFIQIAKNTLEIESIAVEGLRKNLQNPEESHAFIHAVNILLNCKGRIVVSGIGKSGHIARKVAATLASTGSPAFFVHPAEASHGDLGMIKQEDVLVALSYSGETNELLEIIPLIKRMGAKLIALTGFPQSSLAKLADAHLNVHVDKEACPLNLAPTASSTATLAMGDAIAMVLLDSKEFNAHDFALSHPGGSLGKKLLTYVRDVMRTGDAVPKTLITASLKIALLEISQKRLGMTVIVNDQNQVLGIFTDGDLRRFLEKNSHLDNVLLKDIMSPNPKTISKDVLAAQAIEMMDRLRINQLVIVDAMGRLEGALNMHDLLSEKII